MGQVTWDEAGYLSPLEALVESDIAREGLRITPEGILEFWRHRIEWFGRDINQQWAWGIARRAKERKLS
jgi:hypothetical protein